MVVTGKLDCVNEELSVFGKLVENDPIRPDKAGHYSWFTKQSRYNSQYSDYQNHEF
jgi:hypothetical protein